MRFILLIILIFITHIASSQNAMWVVPPQYDQILAFNEDVAAVQKSGKWGYINKDGEIIADCKYDRVYPFSEGLGVATSLDNTIIAIIDKKGSVIDEFRDGAGQSRSYKIDPRFALYGDGLLLVTDGTTAQLYDRRKYKKWGYINQNGVLQINIKYFGALPFSEGVAGVAYDNLKYAYINPSGAVVITNDFNKSTTIGAMGFYQGKSIVVGEKGLAYIDNRGQKASGSLVKFTPLENFYNTTSNVIRGEEGNLEFDAKGRITSLVNKQGERIQIRDELSEAPLSIVKIQKGSSVSSQLKTGAISVAQFGNKMGLIMASNDSPLSVKLENNVIEAVSNAPAYVQFTINNSSDKRFKGVNIYCDDKLVASNVDVADIGYDFKVAIIQPTNQEKEDIDLNIRVENSGLELLNQRCRATIINKTRFEKVAEAQPKPKEKEVVVDQVETTTVAKPKSEVTQPESNISYETIPQKTKSQKVGGFLKN